MSNDQQQISKPSAPKHLVSRIVSGLLAAAALAGAGYLAYIGLELASAATTSAIIRDHAPAVLGLPILMALAAAVVCGARTLEVHSYFEFLGLRAEGVAAIVTGWTVVFATLVVALRALW